MGADLAPGDGTRVGVHGGGFSFPDGELKKDRKKSGIGGGRYIY
jgi:hypothetical protein